MACHRIVSRTAMTLASALLLAGVAGLPNAAAGSLCAGVATIDITPDKPVKLAGYGARKGLSQGVHDPLSARVVVFENADARLVLVCTDLLGFYNGTDVYLRKALLDEFKLQPGRLFLSAIHTHAGPTLSTDPNAVHANNAAYTEALRTKLTKVIREAISNLKPVTIGAGRGSCPVGVNRRELVTTDKGQSYIRLGRNPYGPTDKEVLVLKVGDEDKPTAILFDYATHATSLGGQNYRISGDVLGLAEQFVERIYGEGTIAPAFAGASGDIDPWFRVLPAFNEEPGWVPEPVLLGTFLGEEAVHVARQIKTSQTNDTIRCAFENMELPAALDEEGNKKETVPFAVTVARLGDVAFVGLGGEVLNEIGREIKAASPCPYTFVITHCNGASGYLVPAELHVEGGYEVQSSRYAPRAADLVAKKAIAMLHDL